MEVGWEGIGDVGWEEMLHGMGYDVGWDVRMGCDVGLDGTWDELGYFDGVGCWMGVGWDVE